MYLNKIPMQISRLTKINETPLCLFHFLQNQLTSNLTQNLRNCGPPLDQIELDPQDHKQGILRAIERHVHSSPTHSNKLVNLNLKSWSFDVSISRQLFHFFFYDPWTARTRVVSRSFDEWPVQGSTPQPATSSFPKFPPSTAGSFVIANFQKEKWLSGQKFKFLFFPKNPQNNFFLRFHRHFD